VYPIIELGPLNLGSGALLLVIAVFIGHTQFERIAHKRGGDELEQRARRCAPFALLGAAVGARLWYGLFNWDMYSQSPGLFLALRLGDLAWPGALIGGALAGYAYLRLRRLDAATAPLADAAALALPRRRQSRRWACCSVAKLLVHPPMCHGRCHCLACRAILCRSTIFWRRWLRGACWYGLRRA
jgi:prolipoprotein diacylglyceryltransferase